MFRAYPLWSRFLVALVFPLGLLGAGTVFYFRASLPQADGALRLPALQGKVEIARDSYGVTYIKARSERDVYFAMGVAHAQDRLWQLEIQRREAQGRLCEVFGRKMTFREAGPRP